jgi:hypothetical protein
MSTKFARRSDPPREEYYMSGGIRKSQHRSIGGKTVAGKSVARYSPKTKVGAGRRISGIERMFLFQDWGVYVEMLTIRSWRPNSFAQEASLQARDCRSARDPEISAFNGSPALETSLLKTGQPLLSFLGWDPS